MPCSGRSIDTTIVQASANESAIATASVRLRVMPCWTIATGQPPTGMPGQADEPSVRGTVTKIGTVTVVVGPGIGLNIVT